MSEREDYYRHCEEQRVQSECGKSSTASSFAAPTGLDALFEKYVAADTEAREICERMLAANTAFKDAERRRDKAWEEYNNAKKQSASNS